MGFFQKASAILGMNARNQLFISKYNSKASKRFADDKLFSKHFLASRNIGVAKLYRTIESHQDLLEISADDLPESFVIKPNHGFGGEGIMVIKERKGNIFISVSERRIPFEELFLHCSSILDGKYSISGLSDKVIIEERLDPHESFAETGAIGLPDVRIIVFNSVPIIAMLRIPTPESEGKANVHLGGIGVGVDIGSGKTTNAVQRNKRVYKFINGRSTKNFQVPFWDELLLSAAKIQVSTKIGFLAVDFVVSKTGVKVLEVNARAGLMVQIANQVPLRARLEKVRDLKVTSAEKGVEIAKTLFSQKIVVEEKQEWREKPTIGIFEEVTFLGEKNEQIFAKIDLHASENLVDSSLFDEEDLTADIVIAGKRKKLPFREHTFEEENIKMVLAGKYLTDFVIDVTKDLPVKGTRTTRHGEEKLLKNIDRKLCEVDEAIKLLSYFKPLNLEEEKEVFLKHPRKSPQFFYKVPQLDFEELKKNLSRIPRQCDHPLMPLFEKKKEEVLKKIELIESINTPKVQEISESLWGKADENLYKKAIRFINTTPMEEDESKFLSSAEILQRVKNFFAKQKLMHWKIEQLESTVSDFQISKKNIFFIKKGAKVTENRLLSLLAHEIETHVYRLENGRKAPYKIFERGTAGYLRTEEGLASYNQIRVGAPIGEKMFWGAHRVVSAFLGKKMSFVDLFHYLRNTFDFDEETAWYNCLKVKRGFNETEQRYIFAKDAIYFRGKEEVEDYLQKHPEGMKNLYKGKIAINDLEILKNTNIEEWDTPFLPTLTIAHTTTTRPKQKSAY